MIAAVILSAFYGALFAGEVIVLAWCAGEMFAGGKRAAGVCFSLATFGAALCLFMAVAGQMPGQVHA